MGFLKILSLQIKKLRVQKFRERFQASTASRCRARISTQSVQLRTHAKHHLPILSPLLLGGLQNSLLSVLLVTYTARPTQTSNGVLRPKKKVSFHLALLSLYPNSVSASPNPFVFFPSQVSLHFPPNDNTGSHCAWLAGGSWSQRQVICPSGWKQLRCCWLLEAASGQPSFSLSFAWRRCRL